MYKRQTTSLPFPNKYGITSSCTGMGFSYPISLIAFSTVSYTHLPNPAVHKGGIKAVAIATPGITFPFSFVDKAIIPVSYTHLDVYKRQGLGSLRLLKFNIYLSGNRLITILYR